MLMTVKQCLEQLTNFDDTNELAARLLRISENLEPEEAYFLREAATNMGGLATLARSMAGRLQQFAAAMPDSLGLDDESPRLANLKVPTAGPIPAATASGQLLDLPRVLQIAGCGRTTWISHVKSGAGPKPVRIGRRTFWLQSEVESWVEGFLLNRKPN